MSLRRIYFRGAGPSHHVSQIFDNPGGYFGGLSREFGALRTQLPFLEHSLTFQRIEVAAQQDMAVAGAEFLLELSNEALRSSVCRLDGLAGFCTPKCDADAHDRAGKRTARAAHSPMPLQKAVAALGRSSDLTPIVSASASTTLSAQYSPEANESSAALRTFKTNRDSTVTPGWW